MAGTSRTFRDFVSSTLSELVAERNALQEHPFPRLRELSKNCGTSGRARWRAMDVRACRGLAYAEARFRSA
jgi:hypothetical protein